MEQYNRLIEQEAKKHWEPVEPHEHIYEEQKWTEKK